MVCQIEESDTPPKKDRTLSQVAGERDRWLAAPASPAAVRAWGCGTGGERGGRAPPAALRPYLRPPHSAHSFARGRVFAFEPRRYFGSPPSESRPFPLSWLFVPSSRLFLSESLHRKEGEAGGEGFSEKHRGAAGVRASGAGLAEQRGALFSAVVS